MATGGIVGMCWINSESIGAQHQALIRSIDKIPSTSKVRPAMCETTGSGVKEGETVLMADDMTFQVGTIYLAVDNGMELRKI